MIRDQALAVAGLVNLQMGGPSVRPYQPAGIWEEATFGKKTYVQDHGDALHRRSLYVFWRRIVGPTTFFDSGARQVCTLKVPITNTPLHALGDAQRSRLRRGRAGDGAAGAQRRR